MYTFLPRRLTINLLLISISVACFIPLCTSSAPALSQKATKPPEEHPSTPPTAPRCGSGRPEDEILCEANVRNQDTIKQVIAEDETANLEPETPSSKHAQDVWASAFNQWIGDIGNTNEEGDPKPKSAKRAIEAALLHQENGETLTDTDPTAEPLLSSVTTVHNASEGLPELADDELKLITRAAHTLLSDTSTELDIAAALDMTTDLCASGDNGRQFATSNGLSALLSLAQQARAANAHTQPGADDMVVSALRALATCSQNNAYVFNAAVAADAIHITAATGHRATWRTRATALRVLVALSDAPAAPAMLWRARGHVAAMVAAATGRLTDCAAGDGRRGCVRAFALVEVCLRYEGAKWHSLFEDAGVSQAANNAMQSQDVDVRESAARVVHLLRTYQHS